MSREQDDLTNVTTSISTVRAVVEASTPSTVFQLFYQPQIATAGTPRRRFSLMRRLMIKLRSGKYVRNSRVVIRHDGEDITKDHALVTTFDTGCEGWVNLISTNALTKTFKLSIQYAEKRPIGQDLHGRDYMSVGEVEIRWWAGNRPRYEIIRAFVIESDRFDLIIGRETMKLIDGRLPIIGSFRGLRTSHNLETVVSNEQEWNVRRDRNNVELQRRKDKIAEASKSQQTQTRTPSQSPSQPQA